MSIDPNDIIPIGDLATVIPGQYDHVVVEQNGRARKALAPEVNAAAAALGGALNGLVAQAEADIAPALANIGYLPPVAFAAGILVDSTRLTVERGGQIYAALKSALPFTTTATFNPGQWRLLQGVTGADLATSAGSGMIGFQQSGLGSALRTLLSKVRETISLSDFTGGPTAADATLAMQRALNTISAAGGGELLLDFNPNIAGQVDIPSNVTLRGRNRRSTIVRLTTANSRLMALGDYRLDDATDDIRMRITLKDLRVDGQGVATHALHTRGMSNLYLDHVDLRNTTQETWLAEQVWDSEVLGSFIGSGSETDHAIRFYSGPSDNCNNIRFNATTFEHCPKGAVVWESEPASVNNAYSFSFNDCKFENCGNTGDPILFVERGALIGLTMQGAGGVTVTESSESNLFRVAQSGSARRIRFADFYLSHRMSSGAPPVIWSIANTQEFDVELVKILVPDQAGYMPVLVGANCNQYTSRGVVVNGSPTAAFSTAATQLPSCSPTGYQANGALLASWRRIGFQPWNLSIDSSGNMQLVNAANGQAFLTLNRTSSLPLMRSERRFACPGTWDNSFVLGPCRLWIDASNRLRIKAGEPTSEADGTVVGAQS